MCVVVVNDCLQKKIDCTRGIVLWENAVGSQMPLSESLCRFDGRLTFGLELFSHEGFRISTSEETCFFRHGGKGVPVLMSGRRAIVH